MLEPIVAPNFKPDMQQVQRLAGEAFVSTGTLVALADGAVCTPDKLADCLEAAAAKAEKAALEVRALCEKYMPTLVQQGKKRPAPVEVAGRLEINEYRWMHFTLNTLLPHCRFSTPQYLSDTLAALMDGYTAGGKRLPHFTEPAMLVIDEHCDLQSRQVYDADNKGWKAIPNALKGRVIEDDDQFSLQIHLLATRDRQTACHIYLLPASEAGDFYGLRYGDYPLPFGGL